jgi:hypothetical protein
MDSRRFDALAKSLSGTDTRRRIVRLLAVLPLGVTLTSVLGDRPETTAKKQKQQTDDDHGSSHRRHRRKAKHRHQTGNSKENRNGKRTGCTPKSKAKTCAGNCGTVRNNCGKRVDCGPCTCATGCPQCQTCDAASGLCVSVTDGTACDDHNVCTQTDSCQGGVCVGANPVSCPPPADNCHVQGTCNPATGVCSNPDKCPPGQDCLSNGTCAVPCSFAEPCTECGFCSGGPEGTYCTTSGVPGTCGCTAGSCASGQFCGFEGAGCLMSIRGCFTACTP